MNGKLQIEGTATPEAAAERALPELLAPAGDWACAKAAVENGADAVYFGLDKFNARMRADNFAEADLPKLVSFLHRRGVKAYVTLNTLVFEQELSDAERYLRAMIAAGVDAVIVQDVGICRLIRRLSPDFPIHASTQMTITSAAGVEFARELGCNLVVLARECSIQEIEIIRRGGSEAAQNGEAGGSESSPLSLRTSHLPLEVFVHGALCVAYSGQCLTSEALGGRSANRGECAQACRMPYELVADGVPVALGDRKYLLSPRDLAGLDLLPELVRAGVTSLKIEGRLKTPEYVANITRLYRQALDHLRFTICDLRAEAPTARQSQIVNPESESPDNGRTHYEMEMAFSRGLHTGWLGGINNQQLVHGRFGKKRGVYLGAVARVLREAVVVRLEAPLKLGDGVVFDAGHPEAPEEGGRIYEIKPVGPQAQHVSEVQLSFGRGDIQFSRVHPGDRLWKTSDPELDRRLRQSFSGDAPKFQRPVDMEIHGQAGQAARLRVNDEFDMAVEVESVMPVSEAQNQPLTTARLREQLGRLGGTPFRLRSLANHLAGSVMIPVSELNRLRRAAIEELERRRARPSGWTLSDPVTLAAPEEGSGGNGGAEVGQPRLHVLVRDLAQLEAALSEAIERIYCEFEDPKKYRDAVARVRAHQSQISNLKLEIFVAPPRIFKTGEEWILEQVRSSGADGYLVRNYDHLRWFAKDRCVGDYSLNVANHLSAEYLKRRFRLERLTVSYDLNFEQLDALLGAAPPGWFEITLHQHMPMFHMEHCVFCAFLSTGTDYRNCGRPCDRHELKLRDRVGAEHPVKADAGCRNTVFQSKAQTGAEQVTRMLERGVRHFRLEFLQETPDQVRQTLRQYQRLVRGEITGTQVWRELKLMNQLGVTRSGQY